MDDVTVPQTETCGPPGRTGRRHRARRLLVLLAVGLSLVLADVGTSAVRGAVARAQSTVERMDVSAYAEPPVATVGDTVTFTVLVENSGDGSLHGLVIAGGDDVDREHEHDDTVLPGAIVEHTVETEIGEDDARVGSVTATFVAEADDGAGAVVRSAAVVTVEVLGHPRLRGAVWAGEADDGGGAATSRGVGVGTSIALVALFTVLAALIGGWLIGRVGTARS